MLSLQAALYASIIVYIASIYTVLSIARVSFIPHLHSEWLCWCILWLISKIAQDTKGAVYNDATIRPDKLAMAIAAVCLFSSIGRVYWALSLVTPFALFIARDESILSLPYDSSEKTDVASTLRTRRTPGLRMLITSSIALLSAAANLPTPNTPWDIGTGVAYAICLMVVYGFLNHKRAEFAQEEQIQIPIAMQATSWRVVAILTMMLLVTSDERPDLIMLGLIATIKALQWLAIMALASRGYLLPTSTLATFAISSFQTFYLQGKTNGRMELLAGVALVSLGQTYSSTTRLAYSRISIIVIGFVFMMSLISRQFLTHQRVLHEPWTIPYQQTDQSQLHPIETLVLEANTMFTAMLESQSKSLPNAIAEYERRYNMVPPPGFEQWYEFAVESNSAIIDNYDTVMHSLEPFWGLSAKELRSRAAMITSTPLANFHVHNHQVSKSEDTLVLADFNTMILEWLERYQNILSDLDFVVNGLAEPRVIIPNDKLNHLVRTCPKVHPQSPDHQIRKALEVMDLSKSASWQIGTRSCPEESPSRSLWVPKHQSGIQFVSNATRSKDWCETPEAAFSHGMFVSPVNLKITDTLVPVFSHGKPSSSQDILYPSPDYVNNYRHGNYNEDDDPPWEEKSNEMYWAGSDTGGYAIDGNWRHMHRQRFVDLVTDGSGEISLLHHNELSGQWDTYSDTMSNLTDLVDVHFTSMDNCYDTACNEEMGRLAFGEADAPSVAYQHRFLFDVDGQGRTERYYKLLGSRSTVLKQTMHQEWHDDRLVPWVHYVPISLSLKELPEIMRFLALTEKGQEISKNIAEAGREWQQRALREKDLELAFLRIMLEYARLVGDERDQSGYCPKGRVNEG